MLRWPLAAMHRFFSRLPPRYLWPLLAAFIGLLGVIDFATGYEASFSIFYLMPVGIAARYGRTRDAYGVAMTSALTWLLIDWLTGHNYSHPYIALWNALVRLGFFLIVAHLVLDLRKSLQQQHALARTDALTGILNRLAFQEQADALLRLTRRQRQPISLAYLDVDNFKAVNDGQGHDSGDRALRTIAQGLRDSLRGTDLVARLGGDEFAVLLPDTDAAAAALAVRKARDRIMEAIRRQGWPITLSIGLVSFRQPPASLEEAIGAADRLMYRVKTDGKNAITQQSL